MYFLLVPFIASISYLKGRFGSDKKETIIDSITGGNKVKIIIYSFIILILLWGIAKVRGEFKGK